jgi:hypothetical protein
MAEFSSCVAGVRLSARDRAIAIKLGNGNISQGVRYALRLAADERATVAPLSEILRSAVRMAESLESKKKL